MAPAKLSREEARRIALAASGFDKPRPQRVTAATVARTIRRLGLPRTVSPDNCSQQHLDSLEHRVKAVRALTRHPSIDVSTVETYRARIKEKLNLENASQLAHEAIRWVEAGGTASQAAR